MRQLKNNQSIIGGTFAIPKLKAVKLWTSILAVCAVIAAIVLSAINTLLLAIGVIEQPLFGPEIILSSILAFFLVLSVSIIVILVRTTTINNKSKKHAHNK